MESMDYMCDEKENGSADAKVMRELKVKSKVILRLYYFERLSVSDISIVLDIPQGTVKSRLFKARQE